MNSIIVVLLLFACPTFRCQEIDKKRGGDFTEVSLKQRQIGDDVSDVYSFESEWYMTVAIGGQDVELVIDTGSPFV